MTMQTQYHSEYKGASIYRQWGGYALPWTARIEGQGTVASDTLAGIKKLIARKAEQSA